MDKYKDMKTQMWIKITTKSTTRTIKGRPNHHPLRLMSWRRRTITAAEGKVRPTLTIAPAVPVSPKGEPLAKSMIPAAIPARTWNKMNHQYSERVARPEKVAYLRKHSDMDSPKDISTA